MTLKNLWQEHRMKIILIVSAIILLIYATSRCNSPKPVLVRDKSDSLISVIQHERQQTQQLVISWQHIADSLKVLSDSRKREAENIKKEIRKVIAKGNNIVLRVDTVYAGPDYDSLAVAFEDLGDLTEHYINEIEEMTTEYQNQLAAKDSIIAKQVQLTYDLQRKMISVSDENIILTKQYNSAIKSLRRAKGWSKFFAGVGGAGIIVATIKK
jgi:NAD kinase